MNESTVSFQLSGEAVLAALDPVVGAEVEGRELALGAARARLRRRCERRRRSGRRASRTGSGVSPMPGAGDVAEALLAGDAGSRPSAS